MKADVKLFENGKRLDGRKPDELRPIKIEVGVLHRAEGSCYLEWGGNKVLAAVYGPREAIPRHTQNPLRAIVNARYNMAAFSVDDRKRPGPDRRSREISKVISEALENVILVENFLQFLHMGSPNTHFLTFDHPFYTGAFYAGLLLLVNGLRSRHRPKSVVDVVRLFAFAVSYEIFLLLFHMIWITPLIIIAAFMSG